MKPVWEETWEADWDRDYSVTLRFERPEGTTSFGFGTISAAGPEGVARAKLCAAAPDMARVLLTLSAMCPACEPDTMAALRGEHEADCPLMAALRKAGVR